MNSDGSTPSRDKKPSPELFSLIKAAANDLLSFGELWNSIKKKGHDEGFSEKELQDMLRPFLKEKLDSRKVWYLFHADEQKQRSHEQYQNRTNISTNDVKKDIEQSPKPVPVKDSEQFYKEQQRDETNRQQFEAGLEEKPDDKWLGERGGGMGPTITKADEEEPTELELANIKIVQLEDALHKTQQFKPATQLQETPAGITFSDETLVFEWLAKRDNGVTCYWYPNYGIDLFPIRILSYLKSKGVTTFKRLYFEV